MTNPEYEYMTVRVDNRPRQQARDLKKLAKEGWGKSSPSVPAQCSQA
jgi:hypothetical protein